MPDLFSQPSSVSSTAVDVSEFVRQVRRHLESGIPLGWIRGEISGLTRAGSGHIYFSLKDADAQMRCAMWRNKAQLLPFQLAEGMQVEVRAQITVYEQRGEMQLSVEQIRRAGQGNLFEAFMRLKAKLEGEGLFDAGLKRPLPALPRHIGIVTSSNAAALQDVLAALSRRAPGVALTIYPTPVQGESAGESIAKALTLASDRSVTDQLDALILCRGGGSLEDLWAFNHEAVVRALRACRIPVVSGVGHETDTTLADFAADVRAATPTAAAELISAGWSALADHLPNLQLHLVRSTERVLDRAGQRIDLIEHQLVHPQQRIQRLRAQLTHLALQLEHRGTRHLAMAAARMDTLRARFTHCTPDTRQTTQAVSRLEQRLQHGLRASQQLRHERLLRVQASLKQLSPEAVLQRGYSIVRDMQGQIVRDAGKLHPDERVELMMAKGSAKARIEDIRKD